MVDQEKDIWVHKTYPFKQPNEETLYETSIVLQFKEESGNKARMQTSYNTIYAINNMESPIKIKKENKKIELICEKQENFCLKSIYETPMKEINIDDNYYYLARRALKLYKNDQMDYLNDYHNNQTDYLGEKGVIQRFIDWAEYQEERKKKREDETSSWNPPRSHLRPEYSIDEDSDLQYDNRRLDDFFRNGKEIREPMLDDLYMSENDRILQGINFNENPFPDHDEIHDTYTPIEYEELSLNGGNDGLSATSLNYDPSDKTCIVHGEKFKPQRRSKCPNGHPICPSCFTKGLFKNTANNMCCVECRSEYVIPEIAKREELNNNKVN